MPRASFPSSTRRAHRVEKQSLLFFRRHPVHNRSAHDQARGFLGQVRHRNAYGNESADPQMPWDRFNGNGTAAGESIDENATPGTMILTLSGHATGTWDIQAKGYNASIPPTAIVSATYSGNQGEGAKDASIALSPIAGSGSINAVVEWHCDRNLYPFRLPRERYRYRGADYGHHPNLRFARDTVADPDRRRRDQGTASRPFRAHYPRLFPRPSILGMDGRRTPTCPTRPPTSG